jgi:hypothetical protein
MRPRGHGAAGKRWPPRFNHSPPWRDDQYDGIEYAGLPVGPLIRKLFAYTRSEWSPLAATFVEALQRLRWPTKPDGSTAIP